MRRPATYTLLVLALFAASSCVRGGFIEQHASGLEDGGRDRSAGDRSVADVGPLGLFGAPAPIDALLAEESRSDEDPALTTDMLELYFVSWGRAASVGGDDIWVTTRASLDQPWQPPRLVAPISTTEREGNPAISGDGLLLLFAAKRGKSDWDIYQTTRSSRTAAWAMPTPISELNTDDDELPSYISDDRLTITFHGVIGDTTLFQATRPDVNSPWGPRQPLVELNSPAFESDTHLAAGGMVAVFDSNREGGAGLRDLYLAERNALGTPFGAPRPLVELNTQANDADPWLSDDLRVLFFARSPSDSGSLWSQPFRIFEARR